MTHVSSIDLPNGVVALADGQRIPITRYLGPADLAPEDNAEIDGFDWVSQVVAGPDADGNWLVVEVTEGPKS